MRAKILPLEQNEYNTYTFEVWQMGYLSEEHTFTDLNSARSFYASHGSSRDFALKLFINGKYINFLKMSESLKIDHRDMWRLHLNF